MNEGFFSSVTLIVATLVSSSFNGHQGRYWSDFLDFGNLTDTEDAIYPNMANKLEFLRNKVPDVRYNINYATESRLAALMSVRDTLRAFIFPYGMVRGIQCDRNPC